MSDSGEKTEEPTDKKLQDSREKGQIAPKKSAVDTFSLFAGFTLIWLYFETLSMQMQTFTEQVLDLSFSDYDAAQTALADIAWQVAITVYSLVGSVALATILFGLAMNNFNYSLEPLMPDLKKINPVSGLQNIISMQALVNLGRLLLFFITLSVTLYLLLFADLRRTMSNVYCGIDCIAIELLLKLKILVAVAVLSQLFLSVIDVKMQAHIFRKQQRMTKDEVKRENKDIYGNPIIKNQRSSIAREDAAAPMLSEVTHVVYSSEHLVAIINWDDQKRLPHVMIKAAGENVPRLLTKFKSNKNSVIYMPDVAKDFFEMAVTGKELPPRSGAGMAKIMNASTNRQ
ncbi:EscU/YscU/HrcU family type III secretion system export apparatus switch protein [uncultured Roseibium sp.]|uniref:EscU/YscU/HrcU family type III secretion system export apparatus switch protein n=1 Tax=uncultured Roseibium sp. TaxID=1936171 RepID=UPI002626D0E3|nr:EscU/YscU/HrcU family type III secretion system export apparatus switch protein [uncultured Roseibium sp.]